MSAETTKLQKGFNANRIVWALQFPVVAFAYILTGKLGFLLAIDPGNVSAIWPPSGIALFAVLTLGNVILPSIWIGSFLVNLWFFSSNPAFSTSTGIEVAAIIASGSTLQAFLGAFVLKKFKINDIVATSTNVMLFVITEIIICLIGASVGVSSMSVKGIVHSSNFQFTWLTWWLGDLTGTLTIAPLLFAWLNSHETKLDRWAIIELVCLSSALVLVCNFVFFGGVVKLKLSGYPTGFFAVPFIVWAAVRFNARILSSALVVVSIFAICGTIHNMGPFSGPNLSISLLLLQGYITTHTITGLLLNVTVQEKVKTEKELEQRVILRTQELESSLQKLRHEIAERSAVQQKLIQSEQRLNDAQKIAKIGSWEWDLQTQQISFSDELYDLLEIRAGEKITEEVLSRYCLNDDREKMRSYIRAAIENKRPFSLIHRTQVPNRGERTFHTVGSLVASESGTLTRMHGTIQDVTEERQIEAKIQELNRKLQENVTRLELANQELEAFSYSVSHDLRAPLRHMEGFTSIIQEKLKNHPDEEIKSFLQIITNSARRMTAMIDGLLSFSRTSHVEINKEELDMNDTVRAVKEELVAEQPHRTIRWILPPLPKIVGDPLLVRIVITNLLSNAIKYTSKKAEAEIEIGSKSEAEQQIFYIKDNGVGFNTASTPNLFGVFQRFHRTEEYDGTGIGLAIVRRIIHRHGGKVWAESREGSGATFYFSLPVTSKHSPT